jgi:uncharacterized membrane protein YkvA (DUF1232 family)
MSQACDASPALESWCAISNLSKMIQRLTSLLLPRILRFRKQVVILWHAFWAPATPLHLKAATLFAVLYLVIPTDLVPDFIPVLGWIDDIIIVPLIVNWIVSRLDANIPAPKGGQGPIIEGTAREQR